MPSLKISPVAKAVAAAVGGVATAVSAAFADDLLTFDDAPGVVTAVGVLLTVIGVYKAENRPA